MTRPRIAISHNLTSKVQPYMRAVEMAGGEPVHVTAESGASMHGFDGLILCGGVDVNPALYAQEPQAETDPPNDARDRFEGSLLQEALDADKPVLAICRGFQLFNVAHGGTLVQHLENGRHDSSQPDVHSAHVDKGTRLASAMGTGDFRVNSRHHQAVEQVGDGLVVSAHAEDGLVEGLERPDKKFAVAVQWHPEDLAPFDPAQLELFRNFIAAARCAAN
jgi:putative glutamine amidotransferase